MKRVLFCLMGVLCASGCGRAPEAETIEMPVPVFDGAAAFRECADFVKLGPKPAMTPSAEAAAVYLERRLRAVGAEARIDTFEDAVPRGTGTFRNVLGRIPGDTNCVIVIAAHYDTKTGISADFAGANDSGSGVGVVLEIMRTMAGVRREGGAEIRAAFFDGEECRREYGPRDGLHGSRHLARQWVESGEAQRVKAFILVDMVGDRDLTVTLPPNGTPDLLKMVFEAARLEGVRDRFFLSPGGILDDHEPFLNAGIPSVDLIDFRYGSTPGGNEYWHTAADTMDKLDAASMEAVGRVVLRVMAMLPGQVRSRRHG